MFQSLARADNGKVIRTVKGTDIKAFSSDAKFSLSNNYATALSSCGMGRTVGQSALFRSAVMRRPWPFLPMAHACSGADMTGCSTYGTRPSVNSFTPSGRMTRISLPQRSRPMASAPPRAVGILRKSSCGTPALGQLIRTFGEHAGRVYSVAYSGMQNACFRPAATWTTCSGCGRLRQAFYPNIEGVPASVRSAAFSPDGKRLVSGSNDNTLRLWDIASGKLIRMLENTGEPVWVNSVEAVAFSPDGVRVLSGRADYTLRLWDAATGQLLQVFPRHRAPITTGGSRPLGRVSYRSTSKR